jgi:urease accessory protein
MKLNLKEIRLPSFVLLLTPVMLFAHPDMGQATGFWHGFSHPLTGLDHILAMFAIGIWAVQVGGKAIWAIPLSFVGMMIVGGILGMSGVRIPYVETGIVMSVMVLGVLIIASARLPLAAGMLIAGIFAIFHGHSHGTEIPNAAMGITYSIGFAISTLLLHLSGIDFALFIGNKAKTQLLRYAGATIAIAGIIMLFI